MTQFEEGARAIGARRSERRVTFVCAALLSVAACGGDTPTQQPGPNTGASATPASPIGPGATAGSVAPAGPTGPTAPAGSTPSGRAGAGAPSGPAAMSGAAGAPAAPAAGSPAPTQGAAGAIGDMDTTAAAGAAAPAAEGGEGSCLDVVTDYAAPGPFQFELRTEGSIFMWVPMVPPGCKVPVTHLANGTGAGCMNYEEINGHLASHGFLAACYDNGNTGAGDQGIMALEKVFELYPDLADKKIGSTGHSQGGQASFIVLQYAEAKWGPDYRYAGLAMEPASGFGAQPSQGTWSQIYGMIKSPMFMFSGTADTLVAQPWVASAYAAMGDTEVYFWSAVGATHVPTPDAHTQQVAVPWFRWKLLGDKKACEAFKALPDTDQWNVVEQKNDEPC